MGPSRKQTEGRWPYRDHHQAHTGVASVWPCLPEQHSWGTEPGLQRGYQLQAAATRAKG